MSRISLVFLISFLSLLLTSCVNSGGFTCPDAKGAKCMMLSNIDEQVSSGEIEKLYKQRCFGSKCRQTIKQKPVLAENNNIKARISNSNKPDEYLDGDDLYVK